MILRQKVAVLAIMKRGGWRINLETSTCGVATRKQDVLKKSFG
jgi:hypothetical protein